MMPYMQTFVRFDPYTGEILGKGQGRAIPRDGLFVAEIIDVDFHDIDPAAQKVDLNNITERGDLPRIATLVPRT